VVICRSGASTLAELVAYEIPALTVPWRAAADGHQEANARCFAASTGNFVWIEREDSEENELEGKLSRLLQRSHGAEDVKRDGNFTIDAVSSALWRLGREWGKD
jgi:UDP-N-acetylglucosamine--N-acetylmuramyl-(pentapeptide) pyrophosphoryl-undecaprenol N-acetylglucosamine transferase